MAEPLSREEINRHIAVLNELSDSGQLAASAVALAGSGDRDAVIALARSLRSTEFLSRLDDTANPDVDIANLTHVFRTLAEHPSEATGRLCEVINDVPDFGAVPARINLLLGALAAVRPTTPEGADVFRATSEGGYAEVNAPLLLENESPLALQVFEEIITRVEPYVAVDMLHRSVLPRRTRLPVLETCARLLERNLPAEVRAGVIETLFDYQSRYWFGPAMNPPAPPAWESASTEALEFLIALAGRLLATPLEDRLRVPLESTRRELENILKGRTP